jgi:hypothetical protein
MIYLKNDDYQFNIEKLIKMKKRFSLLMILMIAMILSCSGQGNSNSTLAPNQTVVSFLKWYNTHLKEFQKIYFIKDPYNNSPAKNYSIDFNSTEKYISKLKSSGFISDYYLDSFRKYFKKCEEGFKKNPQNDGPPSGLEADLIMWSNSDYEEELANMNKVKVVSEKIKGENATVKLKFIGDGERTYLLTKSNGKWLIKMTVDTIEK